MEKNADEWASRAERRGNKGPQKVEKQRKIWIGNADEWASRAERCGNKGPQKVEKQRKIWIGNADEWANRAERRGNKGPQKVEKQRLIWIGKRNLKFSTRDSKADGEPISSGPVHHGQILLLLYNLHTMCVCV